MALKASSIVVPGFGCFPGESDPPKRGGSGGQVQLPGIKTKLRSSRKRGLAASLGLASLLLFRASLAEAQAEATRQDLKPAWRLLTIEEGRSVVSAAWAFEQPAPGTQDCSHLIHAVYKSVGFDYQYDSSFHLYLGNESFVPVKFPRAGDLIAWPGHVGIVIDPRLHSFYSLVRNGLQEQNYAGHYWKSRGTPRFFRYKVQNARAQGATKLASESLQLQKVRSRDATGPILVPEDRSSSDAREELALNSQPTTSGGMAGTYGSSMESESVGASATLQIPSSIVVAPGGKPPTREEVAQGISELGDAAGNVLRTDNPLRAQLPVVIVEHFEVRRLDINRDHGWARLEIDSKASISGGTTQLKARREKIRWELRRTDSGWEVVAPSDRTYVPQDVAVKNLAAQLAQLTKRVPIAARKEEVLRQESQLANLLNTLLKEQ